jgi:uncharacterized protein (TIRG00374 family)
MGFSARKFQIAFGLAITAAVLVWMKSALDWPEVMRELRQVHYWVLIPATLILALHVVFRAMRWHYLLSAATPLRLRFDSIMLGNFATFILPLRAGEFVRPYLLSRRSEESFTRAFASVVMERFFDLATVLILFSVMISRFEHSQDWIQKGARGLSLLAAIIFALMFVACFFPLFARRLLELPLRIVPGAFRQRAELMVQELLEGAAVLRDKKRFAAVVVLSALVWGSACLQYYLFLFLLDTPASWSLGVTIVVAIALAVAAPSAPGFLGVYEAGCIVAFAVFGLGKAPATAYALVTHAFQFFIYVAYGLFVLLRYHMSFSQLREGAETDGV